MICKCGKEFECYHEFQRGDAWFNHCLKCGKGAGGDMCKGKCPECEAKAMEEFKLYAENCLE